MVVKFTLPLADDVAAKMTFIGKYYGRSRVREIEWACKEWVRRFEAEQGEIKQEDLQALKEAEYKGRLTIEAADYDDFLAEASEGCRYIRGLL